MMNKIINHLFKEKRIMRIRRSIKPDSAFADEDIDFIERNMILSKQGIKELRRTKKSEEPCDCLKHRRIQEILRDDYNHFSDQETWNKNNKIVHSFFPGEYQ